MLISYKGRLADPILYTATLRSLENFSTRREGAELGGGVVELVVRVNSELFVTRCLPPCCKPELIGEYSSRLPVLPLANIDGSFWDSRSCFMKQLDRLMSTAMG